jgi:cellobiose PTS system EIIC component
MIYNAAKIKEKMQEGMVAFANNKYIKSISDGMIFMMTPIIVGSIFMLFANLPIATYKNFIDVHGITFILKVPVTFTINIMAVLSVFFIAYNVADQFEKDGGMAGLLALISFFIVTPMGEIKNNNHIFNYISFDWLGPKGLFVAIIIGMVTARIYVFFVQKGLVIKMPEGVPPAVSKSFTGLVPGFVTTSLALLIFIIFKYTPFGSLNQMIYNCIQIPLEGLSASYGALLIVNLAIGVLWFFGLHGTIIVFNGIMAPVYLAMDMENLAAYEAGTVLPNILGYQFFRCYVFMSGTGMTIGLMLVMAFFAKSSQYKTLGRLALPMSIFNINEPLIFGTPIVLNPFMLIPFLLTPLVTSSIAYIVTAIGIVPRLNGIQIPWPTPMILSGLMEGSWKIAVLQVILALISFSIYYFPFKALDRRAWEQEKKNSVDNA